MKFLCYFLLFVCIFDVIFAWKTPNIQYPRRYHFAAFEKYIIKAKIITKVVLANAIIAGLDPSSALGSDKIVTEVATSGRMSNPFKFEIPSDFVDSPKLVKTHKYELYYKSQSTKGLNVGLTVDPVRIDSVIDFASAEEVANRVLNVEKGKEGFLDGRVLNAKEVTVTNSKAIQLDVGRETKISQIPAYELDYEVQTTRSNSHYLVRVTIADKNLYVLTIQSPTDKFNDLSSEMHSIIDSFQI